MENIHRKWLLPNRSMTRDEQVAFEVALNTPSLPVFGRDGSPRLPQHPRDLSQLPFLPSLCLPTTPSTTNGDPQHPPSTEHMRRPGPERVPAARQLAWSSRLPAPNEQEMKPSRTISSGASAAIPSKTCESSCVPLYSASSSRRDLLAVRCRIQSHHITTSLAFPPCCPSSRVC